MILVMQGSSGEQVANQKTDTSQEAELNSANQSWQLRPIAHIKSEFGTKFGVPRQAGLVPELQAVIEFEPEFRNPDAIRGLEQFSHLWLLWIFNQNLKHGWSVMSRPPRFGGNTKLGVFATRSPFRPNPIGQSVVKILDIETVPQLRIQVAGADLVDGTPIVDLKPYVRADAIYDANFGFTAQNDERGLTVHIPDEYVEVLTPSQTKALRGVLAQNPVPAYQNDAKRIYGMEFCGRQVKFQIVDGKLTVTQIV